MSLFIHCHPTTQTLLSRVYSDTCPDGYEPSTEEDADAWIAEQLAAGWEPEPDEELPAPISPVTQRQFRLALIGIGISPAAIDALLADDELALTEWQFAQEISPAHPLVESLRVSLGKTHEEVDALFASAASL